MTKFSKALVAILTLTGIAFASGAHAALVPDGDFANPFGGASYTIYNAGAPLGPWVVTAGNVKLVGNYWQPPVGTLGTVDLDGTTAGGIAQSLILNPGTYDLTFSLSGNPNGGDPTKAVQVYAGGAIQNFSYNTSTAGNSDNNMKYVTETVPFTVSGVGPKTELFSFLSQDSISSAFGAVIGDVQISQVPLPATALLFGAALLGLASFGAYRRRQAV